MQLRESVHLERLDHAVEDEPYPDRRDEEADDAGGGVDPQRPEPLRQPVGVGEGAPWRSYSVYED